MFSFIYIYPIDIMVEYFKLKEVYYALQHAIHTIYLPIRCCIRPALMLFGDS